MACVTIDDLRCGMVLSGDVLGRNGRRLLAGGTVLAENHLRVLRIWGVSQAEILGRETASDNVSGPPHGGEDARLEAAGTLADARFVIAGRDQAAVAELHRLCVRELAAAPAAPAVAAAPAAAPPAAGPAGALPAAPADPQALLAGEPSLASFPDIHFRLQEALRDPGASAGHIAGIIGRDPGLAAGLLRLANSPLYGLARPVDSLARGVLVIGAGELAQLALGVAVVARFRDLPAGSVTMRQAWEHAVGCGVLAQILAVHVGGLPKERLFVAGLLHDLGRLVMLRRAPRHMARAMDLAREGGMALFAAERRVFGYDHAAVGEALLTCWRLPPELAEAVGGHHGGRDMRLDAAVVHVADVMAVAAGFGFNGSPLVPPLDARAFAALSLPPSVLGVALSQARRQVGDILATLLA
uniref:Putative signal transduction protein n=1 Tax=Desulfovibrio sp. U5L TaxID=596152 RepID=I2Q6E5_9BACT